MARKKYHGFTFYVSPEMDTYIRTLAVKRGEAYSDLILRFVRYGMQCAAREGKFYDPNLGD